MHTAGDGLNFPGPIRSVIVPPNLTPMGPLRTLSDAEVPRAIRDGVTADERQLHPAMPHASAYHAFTDEDTAAVVAHLRLLPAADNPAAM